MAVKKAYSISTLEKKNFKYIPLSGEWAKHLGEVEFTTSTLIMGDSGHGKTAYSLQMANAIGEHTKIHYNTAEEGLTASFYRNLKYNNVKRINANFQYSKDDYQTMVDRLNMRKQPKVVFIDSIQYCFKQLPREAYFDLIKMFPTTHFVGISHFESGKPTGAAAMAFYWDCQNRIMIKDWAATIVKSRTDGEENVPFIISQKKYDERNGILLKKG